MLIRAVGPALTALGISGAMENPVLTLYRGQQAIASNDDWGGGTDQTSLATLATRVGAFPLAAGSRDAVLFVTLAPGGYTAQITRAPGSGNGVALIELYDASAGAGDQKLLNVSSRGEVRTGEGILISGFVVTGNFPKKVLIRGVGPSLERVGVSNALADPILRLYAGDALIATNDDWATENALAIDTVAQEVGAFALDHQSKDAAILLSLAPGIYTAHVSGAEGATGIAMVEVYDAP
jgi:hypothetical protein